MNIDIERDFIDLCTKADQLDAETYDDQDVEPLLISILNLVKEHPYERALFVRLFIDVYDNKIPSPHYLLPFCMRDLRFPEIKSRVLEDIHEDPKNQTFLRKIHYISDVLHAFNDDVWEYAASWPYYAHELENEAHELPEKDTSPEDNSSPE